MFGFLGLRLLVTGGDGRGAAVGRTPPSSPAGLAVRMTTVMMKKLQTNLSLEMKRENGNEKMALFLSKYRFIW